MDLADIFAAPDDSASDEDRELALAGQTLVKLASEANVNLQDFDADELQDLVAQLRGESSLPTPEPEASTQMTDTMTDEQIKQAEDADNAAFMDAFIMQETIKAAAANDLDITDLDPSDLAVLKAAVAEEIESDPEAYLAKLAADDEAMEKIAEADEAGRVMARSFFDEWQKLAAATTDEPDAPDTTDDEGEKVAGRGAAAVAAAKGAAGKASGKFNDFATRVGRGVEKHTGLGSKGTKAIMDQGTEAGKVVGRDMGNKATGAALKEHYGKMGKRALGAAGATAAVGAGAGAAAAAHKKKHAEDEAVLGAARALLYANGIDPDSGEKLAFDDEIGAAALELLKEKGWEVG